MRLLSGSYPAPIVLQMHNRLGPPVDGYSMAMQILMFRVAIYHDSLSR
jgi:hypothetical protein